MKKLILTACLMVSAVCASFGGIQYNTEQYDESYPHLLSYSFTFTSDGSYGFLFGSDWEYHGLEAFGYYYISDPANRIDGVLTGNNSDYFSSLDTQPDTGEIADVNTGYLGNFNAGDTIGLWFQFMGYVYTSTDTGDEEVIYFSMKIWELEIFTMGSGFCNAFYFKFVEASPPVGEPLPGVMAALAIGGCAFIGKNLRNRVKNNHKQ